MSPIIISRLLSEDIRTNNGLLLEVIKGIREYGGIYLGKVGLYNVYCDEELSKDINLPPAAPFWLRTVCNIATNKLNHIGCTSTFNVLFIVKLEPSVAGVYHQHKHLIRVLTELDRTNRTTMIRSTYEILDTLIHETVHQIYKELPREDKLKIYKYYGQTMSLVHLEIGKLDRKQLYMMISPTVREIVNDRIADYNDHNIKDYKTLTKLCAEYGAIYGAHPLGLEFYSGLEVQETMFDPPKAIIKLASEIENVNQSQWADVITKWIIDRIADPKFYQVVGTNAGFGDTEDQVVGTSAGFGDIEDRMQGVSGYLNENALKNPSEFFAELITSRLMTNKKFSPKLEEFYKYIVQFVR